MNVIRRFFFYSKTVLCATIATVLFSFITIIVFGVTNQLTLFNGFLLCIQLVLIIDLYRTYYKHDLIQMSATATGLITIILFEQSYNLFEKLFKEDMEAYLKLGLPGCTFVALNCTVLFIQLLILWNHFSLNTYQINGRVKLAVNQLCVAVQALLFIFLAFVSYKIKFDIYYQAWQILHFLKETSLLIAIGCCELILALDKLEFE